MIGSQSPGIETGFSCEEIGEIIHLATVKLTVSLELEAPGLLNVTRVTGVIKLALRIDA